MVDIKTPMSILNEFCQQQKVPIPKCEIFEKNGPISAEFECFVTAFNKFAKGSGRSKADAKHAACTELLRELNLIYTSKKKIFLLSLNKFISFILVDTLERMDCYKHKLKCLMQWKMTDESTNYIGSLYTLCLQRKLSEPK